MRVQGCQWFFNSNTRPETGDYLTLHTRSVIMTEMENIERKPLNAIDALWAGFDLVLRRPWLLLLPIALDLFLWLGPQVHAKPVFDEIARFVSVTGAQGNSPDMQQALDSFKSAFQTAGEQFNVLSFMALFALGIPTLVVVDMPVDVFKPAVLLTITDQAAFLAWAAVLALVGLFLGSLFLEWVAWAIRREEGGLQAFAPRLGKAFLTVLALGLLAIAASTLLIIPFFVSALVMSVLSPGLGFFFVLACWLLLMWAALYLAFAIPAIFVSGASVLEAILNSIAVFRYNFWSAMGLIFLVILIQMGFSVIWEQLLDNTWGMVVDMVANAVLGTALVAAMMLFYADRFTWISQVRERIRHQQRPSLKG